MTDFEELKRYVEELLNIDVHDLSGESLRTPKIHARLLDLYTETSLSYKRMEQKFDELFLERWRYWMGKQTDEYYKKHRPPTESILKQDIEKYMKADIILIKARSYLDEQYLKVEYLKKSIEQCNRRSFEIKNYLEIKRFEAGLN